MSIFKMEMGTYILQRENFNLNRLFSELNAQFTPKANEKQQILNFVQCGESLDFNEEQTFCGEKMYIRTMLENLIDNAIHASPPAQVVTVEQKICDGSCLIDIHNYGVIPKDIRETFFDKYSTSDKKYGTGLGTYSARLIARSHDGDITYRTSEKEGTHILISLPMNKDIAIREKIMASKV